MHSLEYLLVLFSSRIEKETGNSELASELLGISSESHWYTPPDGTDHLDELAEQWRKKFDHG
jgi:hypothetical protein